MPRTFKTVGLLFALLCMVYAPGASASTETGGSEGLLVLSNAFGESLLVHCQGNFAKSFVLVKTGHAGPVEGVPMDTPCSSDSFDGFERDTNVTPHEGWVIYHPARVGGLLGAYTCTVEGAAVFAFVYPEGLDSWKDSRPCSNGTVPG